MSKRRVTAPQALMPAIDLYYNTVSDPSTHTWPLAFVSALFGSASLGSGTRNRYHELAACILVTLPTERRAHLSEKYLIPTEVLEAEIAMGQSAVWPEKLTLADWPTPTAADLLSYQTKLKAALKTRADTEVYRVIAASPRELVAQLFSALSAYLVSNGLHPGATAQAGDFPTVEAHRVRNGNATLEESAAQIVAQSVSWATADEAIEEQIAMGNTNIDAAADIAAAQAAYDTAEAQIVAIVDAVVAAQ